MSRQSHVRVRNGFFVMVTIFLCAMGTITGLNIHANYRSTIGTAERQGLSYARVLAEHASRTLGESDRVLDAVMEDVAKRGGLVKFSERGLYDLFTQRMQHAPQIGSIFAVDAGGRLIASTSAYPVNRLDVSEFDHFRFHRDNQALERFISRPYKNRLNGVWRFSVSRRLNGPDGSFAGYIGVALVEKYFDSFYSTLSPVPTQRISLIRTDGSYLVVAPFNEKAMSLNISNQLLIGTFLQRSPSGTFHNPRGGYDLTDRIVSYCRLPGTYPVVAVVTFEKGAILGVWRSEALMSGSLAIVFASAIVALAAILRRRLHQLERSGSLVSSLLNAVPESMMLIDPDGVILAVNETAAQRLGSEPDWMVGTPIWSYIPAELAEARRARLAEVLATKRPVAFEDQRDRYYFQHVNTPIIDPDMQVRQVAILAFDITEIKRTQMALKEGEETFRQIFYEAPDPILLIDDSSCFVDCNQAAVRMLGASSREQVLMRHPSHFSPEFQPDGQLSSHKANGIIQAVFAQQDMHFEWLHKRQDGSLFDVDISLKLITLNGQKMQLVHWRDITERKQAENTLRKLSTAVEQSPAAIVITDSNGAIEYANPKFYRMTDYTAEEVIGQNPRILKSDTQPQEYYRQLWETIQSGREWEGEFHNRSKHGRLFWEKAFISPIKDNSGAITHFVAVKEDITEHKMLQEQLAKLAHFDLLTGLPNRALFFDLSARAISLAKREHRRCGILFVDLDGFKEINDTYGHETGDKLLSATAERLRTCLRQSDSVARMGGDEFTVILTTLKQRDDAAVVARKILAKLTHPFRIGEHVCHVGASIGISIFPDDADDVDQLLHGADTAMYEVKRSGKNNFCYYLRG